MRQLKDKWHLDHSFLHHPNGMMAIWAVLVTGLNLSRLFLARRVRVRRYVEKTDTGMAKRLQRALLEMAEPLGSYLQRGVVQKTGQPRASPLGLMDAKTGTSPVGTPGRSRPAGLSTPFRPTPPPVVGSRSDPAPD